MRPHLFLIIAAVSVCVCGGCPFPEPLLEQTQRARLKTTLGDIVIELDEARAPVTVANFRQYAAAGFYEGTLFHRVVPGFVIQGGGYTENLELKETRDPIPTEAGNGLSNLKGTVGMARTQAVTSATSQFYINLADNFTLDGTLTNPGYAVFGKVVEGLDVVDAIAAVPTETRDGLADVPVTNVVITSVTLETGPPGVTAEWSEYFDAVRTEVPQAVRNVAVDMLVWWVGGG